MTEHKQKLHPAEKNIATHPTARLDYSIEEVVEAGLVLTGTEVKSLRHQAPHLKDAFVEVYPHAKGFEAWLIQLHIGQYSHGNIWNHETLRKRKLLLHAHQINHMHASITQKRLSIIPLRLYFKRGRVKVELGLGKGKKKHDKRESLKEKADYREMNHLKFDR